MKMNYLAIIVSAVVAYLANAAWFLLLFRVPYMEGLAKTKEQMDKGPSGLSASIMQVIGNVVTAFVLLWLMKKLDYVSPGDGIKLAVIVWLGFVAAVLGPMYAFQAYPLSFYLIVSGSVLLSLLIMGAILGVWK